MTLCNTPRPAGTNYIHGMVALSTFSYAVLFSSLALYLTHQLQFQPNLANSIVALFLTFNFTLHLIAGYIGSRLLSYRFLLILSILFEISGVALLSWSMTQYIYLGLSLFLIGCGFGSTCLKCLLTQKFQANEHRRETAFFINYSAMNLGFFLGFIAGGYFDMQSNYQGLFQVSIFVNLTSLLFLLIAWRHFDGAEEKWIGRVRKFKRLWGVILILFLFLLVLFGFHYESIANYMVLTLGGLALSAFFGFAALSQEPNEKYKIYAFIILSVASIVFWALFFVEPMGITFFLKNNTQTIILGYKLSPQWFLNLNSIFVIIAAPLAALLFKKLQQLGLEISIPKQFSLALILISLSFYLLCWGIDCSTPTGITGGLWIILHFMTQSLGEVLIAPMGYALVGKLAPKRLQGMMMGFWMMGSGISAALSHYFSNLMAQTNSIDPMISNPYYLKVFHQLGLYGLLAAMLLWALSKPIHQLITNDTPQKTTLAKTSINDLELTYID